jgi:hypothetical protein
MNTSTRKQARKGKKAEQAKRRLDRATVVDELNKIGGTEAVEIFTTVEKMSRQFTADTVVHYYKMGIELSPLWVKYERNGMRWIAAGLGKNINVLRDSCRLTDFWTEGEITRIVARSQNDGHELTWSHFRRLLREDLNDKQRKDLIDQSVEQHWSYRDLEFAIRDLVGKKSKGGRRVARPTSFRGAIVSMVKRSREWLKLEDGWGGMVTNFVKAMPDSEKYTTKTLNSVLEAASHLQRVRERAEADYHEAQALADQLSEAMGNPSLVMEDDDGKQQGKVKVAPKKGKVKAGRRRPAATATR